MDMGGGMHMTFYNDWTIDELFFDSWEFKTDGKYAGAIVALFLVSVLVEFIQWAKCWVKYNSKH